MIIGFFADRCGPCRCVPGFDRAAAQDGEIEFGRVDVRTQFALAERFQVSVNPTLLVVRDGAVLARHTGPLSDPGLEQLIADARSARSDAPSAEPATPTVQSAAQSVRSDGGSGALSDAASVRSAAWSAPSDARPGAPVDARSVSSQPRSARPGAPTDGWSVRPDTASVIPSDACSAGESLPPAATLVLRPAQVVASPTGHADHDPHRVQTTTTGRAEPAADAADVTKWSG